MKLPDTQNDADTPAPPVDSKKRAAKRQRSGGTKCVWPKGIEQYYGISAVTRWRWEKTGKLPPRNFFVGGVAVGWKPETIEAAMNG